ncbi:MAG: hypothetical protein AAF356_09140 [Planctomycetota bacterium]
MAERVLHIVPILHAEADLGRVARRLRDAVGEDAWRDRQDAIDQAWRAIAAWASELGDRGESLHVFQDGLPVCGSETRIVRDLARKGSINHRILATLVDAGATLVGTEDPALLLEEYERVMAAANPQRASQVAARKDADGARALLARRDRFIASRIDSQLPASALGVLFIGMLHDVAPMLPGDIRIEHPFGRPQAPHAQAHGPIHPKEQSDAER